MNIIIFLFFFMCRCKISRSYHTCGSEHLEIYYISFQLFILFHRAHRVTNRNNNTLTMITTKKYCTTIYLPCEPLKALKKKILSIPTRSVIE